MMPHDIRFADCDVRGCPPNCPARRVPRPDWDDYFLAIAAVVATRGDCSRRQIGAVIVDQDHRIVATGYNGAPSGEAGCLTAGACPRAAAADVVAGEGYGATGCIAIHAEHNAILYARRDLRGCTLYVTDVPCQQCNILLTAVGISRVVRP